MLSPMGVRLQLLVGPTIPLPAPYPVAESFLEAEVTNRDDGQDGFKLSFTLGKEPLLDYALLATGLLNPGNRAILVVLIGVLPEVLIDGIITEYQVAPGSEPGRSTFHVFGKDLSHQLDLETRLESHSTKSDADIVRGILTRPDYASLGLIPDVRSSTNYPNPNERQPNQRGTDLEYIQYLAGRNGHVFYVEPGRVPGTSTAYWGPDPRGGPPQPPLTTDMGSFSNLSGTPTVSLNWYGPEAPVIRIIEPFTKRMIELPLPSALSPGLGSKPVAAERKRVPCDSAKKESALAATQGRSQSTRASDAVKASGSIDAIRYGRVLRARRTVSLRGVGQRAGGTYYVREVRHSIKRGSYTQSFDLKREGTGALEPTVATLADLI